MKWCQVDFLYKLPILDKLTRRPSIANRSKNTEDVDVGVNYDTWHELQVISSRVTHNFKTKSFSEDFTE